MSSSIVDSAFPAPAATREALLLAAGEVFAQRGFRTATIREICQRAGANVAAVNYHFGDKERLYLEVLRYASGRAEERYPAELDATSTAPPRIQLRRFVHNFLLRLLDSGPCAWHGKLLAMEMIDPIPALDTLIAERIRPMSETLLRLIQQILGPGTPPETARLCGSSIVSQCLYYQHCRSVVSRLFPQQTFDSGGIARLADHITEFSFAALRRYVRRPQSRAR